MEKAVSSHSLERKEEMPSNRQVRLVDCRKISRHSVKTHQLDIFPQDYVKVVDAGFQYSSYMSGLTHLFGKDAVLSSIPYERVTWAPIKPDEVYKVHSVGLFCTPHNEYIIYGLNDIQGKCYLVARDGLIPYMRFKHYQDGEFELPIYDC